MYAKSLFTAALAMLASGVAASGIVLQNVDGSTQTPGTNFEIDWLFAPNDPTFTGFSGTDVVSFQIIDYRLGADKGQLVGTGPLASAPLQAQKVSVILPDTAPGNMYRLAITCNGKTVYEAGTFTIAAGAAGASSAAPAASGAATPAATVAAPSGAPSAGVTPAPSSVVSIAQPTSSLVVVVPNGSKTTVAANPTGVTLPAPSSASSAGAAAATDAAKSGAASSAPALIALAAPAVAVFFL
ncbi:hypothetical protein HDU87_006621 [Geranomyces variabilis]|uniref:Ser-Thr-rich glycosyl-phosphatidyl-inositol-anchored membrane family-domain-containing protein n=1 Tax=Geranomyces variabilis TaxID=109894 RepID=A0AAD5TKL2_9FUNG|nr:hypothetical protein HDU87_006621 [Geranomyces variabilis]